MLVSLDFDRTACCTENKEARRKAGPKVCCRSPKFFRRPFELSVTVFERDDVGVTEAARHGAKGFRCQPQVAGMLRTIVG